VREIDAKSVRTAVAELCVKANVEISPDIASAIKAARARETGDTAAWVLDALIENAEIAAAERMPICQDTGMAVVFVEIGQDARVVGGSLADAINGGVRDGYEAGFLRKSVVSDPIRRINTGDNTPAVIHYTVTSGDCLKITVAPKGFGSENMSAVKMLKPSDGLDGVKDFIMGCVTAARANPCPPVIVGAGVGGTMEKAALLSKTALLRPVGQPNPDPFWAEIEAEMLKKINATGIGPAGIGGNTTALAVNIEVYPTHIAGLPVAVNMGCHVTRHAEATL